jgi:transcriptional regulator with XRE-family HTH domain
MTREEAERFNAVLGRQLRAEIAAAGSSLSAVARELGMSRSALDNYVTGKRSIPVPVAYEVCAVLGVDVQRVVERAQERFGAEAPTSAPTSNVEELSDFATVHPIRKEAPQDDRRAAKRGRRKAAEPHAE